jgi:hypothetical protein
MVDRVEWGNYLEWFRDVTEANVRNSFQVVDIKFDSNEQAMAVVGRTFFISTSLLSVAVDKTSGETQTIFTRKVVVASGYDGAGMALFSFFSCALSICLCFLDSFSIFSSPFLL